MSRTYKLKPFKRKVRLVRTAHETKTTIRHMVFKTNDLDYIDQPKPSYSAKKLGIIIVCFAFLTSSCVSKRLLVDEQNRAKACSEQLNDCNEKNKLIASQYKSCTDDIIRLENYLANEQSKVHMLEQQLEYFKNTNSNLLDRLSDLSVVSKSGAESIKRSLEAINDQNLYIKDLTTAMRLKDSLNLALVMNLKRSLADINDEDVNIEVKKGVVYISISDKLLFKSGSYEISTRAEEVLGKIARVLNDHKELEILVEGHTDNVPISTPCLTDNWDLSAKRATTVVRYLQTKHNISPERMTAGGRSEFVPKSTNTTNEGKAANRRTEIIILPQLDQFFQLVEPPTN